MLPASRPHSDELVFSAVVRCARLFNLPLGKLARVVFAEPHWRASFLGASNLATLARLFRMPAETILWEHTVFPYVTAALSQEAFERATSNFMSPDGKRAGLGKVVDTAARGVAKRRICKRCAEEELRTLGYSYWHRSHHLPGVRICLMHGQGLSDTEIELSPRGVGDRRLPHECEPQDVDDLGGNDHAVRRFAEISVALLSRPRMAGELPNPDGYRRIAAERSVVAQGKRINTEVLLNRLRSLFSDRFLEDAKIALVRRRGAWPFLMLRPGVAIDFPPAKHAAMQVLLEHEDLQETTSSLAYRPAGPNSSPTELLDSFYSKVAIRELRRVRKARLVLTTEQFLRRVGCFSHYRRRRRDLPKLSAVVREFRESQFSVKPLAEGRKLYRDD